MSFVNHQAKEVNCKIVYCGPAMSGKTTNLQIIHSKTAPDLKGRLISLNTQNERTLFFDFLPLDLGEIRGYRTRFHLYTVPGQVFYDSSRRLLLRGVDGIVFVADSQVDRMESNMESLNSLKKSLEEEGYQIQKLPFVMQFNKRDLPNIASHEDLARVLNRHSWYETEAIASEGKGVFETLKLISKLILTELRSG